MSYTTFDGHHLVIDDHGEDDPLVYFQHPPQCRRLPVAEVGDNGRLYGVHDEWPECPFDYSMLAVGSECVQPQVPTRPGYYPCCYVVEHYRGFDWHEVDTWVEVTPDPWPPGVWRRVVAA